MEDAELEAIRARRMAQLQQQSGGDSSAKGQQQAQAAAQAEREQKNMILGQILEQSARSRLNTIALTKREKAEMIENMIIQMAQRGQIPGKINEAALIQLLEQVSAQTKKATTVKFDRRRMNWSDDEDD